MPQIKAGNIMSVNQHESIRNSQVVAKVFKIFNVVSQSSSLAKSYVFDLTCIFKQHPQHFPYAFEQAYLKVFRVMQETMRKNNKKIPAKFQELADQFFKQLLVVNQPHFPASMQFLDVYLRLMAEAIRSSFMSIRIMAARIVFLILKGLSETQEIKLNESLVTMLGKAVIFLLKTGQSTYVQIGVKLASLLLSYSQFPEIQEEFFDILAYQDNEKIRKLVITNIQLSPSNIERVMVRLRDKNVQIRSIIVRKLAADKYGIHKLSQSGLYKLLYDGYGNKDVVVKKQAFKYFFVSFLDSISESPYEQFLQYFQPEMLLINPQIYVFYDQLIGELLTELPQSREYIKKICEEMKNTCKHGSRLRVTTEMVWLKNAAKTQMTEFEEFCPSGLEMAYILGELVRMKHTYGIFQFLQLFSLLQTPDEIGRDKMFNVLKDILEKLECYELQFDYTRVNPDDDICPRQSSAQIQQRKMLLSYYDLPIISNLVDLIPLIGAAMRSLRPDYFDIEMKQIMAEWNDPEENTLLKERETVLTNLRKVEQGKNNTLVNSFKQKLHEIQGQIDRERVKTRLIIITLGRLKPNSSMGDYIHMVKDEIDNGEKPHGLLMLGFYCLQSMENINNFFPLYWRQLRQQQSIPCLLVSLKVTVDLINKFNLLKRDLPFEDYSPDLFIRIILRLVIHENPTVKILAIESLCRMLYHDRIQESNVSHCFVYLLLLWWETSTEEVSAKSVNTISMFVKNYIDKSRDCLTKLAEVLLVFFKLFLKFTKDGYSINKRVVVYNLTSEEFLKKGLNIAITVLKYTKQSKKVIWTYQQAELGPQEYFLAEVLKQQGFEGMLERLLQICDFYETAPIETLLFAKNKLEEFEEQNKLNKKGTAILLRLCSEVESMISIKQESSDEIILKGIERQFEEKSKLVEDEVRRMVKNIQDQQLFVQNQIEQSEEDAGDEGSDTSKVRQIIQEEADEDDSEEASLEKRNPNFEKREDKREDKRGDIRGDKRDKQNVIAIDDDQPEPSKITHRTRSRHKV